MVDLIVNYQMKNMKNMKNNNSYKFLAVVLISLVWISILVISTILAFLFNGDEFFIRFILTLPFTFGGVCASNSIWQKYK